MRRIWAVWGAALIVLLGSALAAECPTTSADADRFSVIYDVGPAGDAVVRMDIAIPFSSTCLVQENLDTLREGPRACDTRVLHDALFKQVGHLILESRCEMAYDPDTEYVNITAFLRTDRIAQEKDGFFLLAFQRWDLVASKDGALTSLRVVLPQDARIVSYFPQTHSNTDGLAISWSPIPDEPLTIKYAHGISPIVWLAMVGGLVLAVGLFLFFRKVRAKQVVGDQLAQKQAELKEIEHAFQKRWIDERAYRQKIAQWQREYVALKSRQQKIHKQDEKPEVKP